MTAQSALAFILPLSVLAMAYAGRQLSHDPWTAVASAAANMGLSLLAVPLALDPTMTPDCVVYMWLYVTFTTAFGGVCLGFAVLDEFRMAVALVAPEDTVAVEIAPEFLPARPTFRLPHIAFPTLHAHP